MQKIFASLSSIFTIVFLLVGNYTIAQETLSTSNIENLLGKEASKKSISVRDLTSYFISDNYKSQGNYHVYLNQAIDGIPIQETFMGIHQYPDYTYSSFRIKSNLTSYIVDKKYDLSGLEAIQSVMDQKGYNSESPMMLIEANEGARPEYVYQSEVSLLDIPVKLWYYETKKNTLSLAWELYIEQAEDALYYQFLVDANSGEIIKETLMTLTCDFGDHNNESGHNHDCFTKDNSVERNNAIVPNSYNVFPWPYASPHDGSRVVEVEPWLDNTTASPNGWHTIGTNSYQHTRGNNVDAYEDSNNSNGPSGGNSARADGGATLDFDFPWMNSGPLVDYQDAVITNLFYWNNVCHDVWYNYGFDEPSGNFQEENYTSTGNASDFVRAEAQDGGGTCNANFATPSDGGNPRMQMYNCFSNGTSRDGSVDNLVIVHEYGHGISIRLTGGPGTSGCLSNTEQMGEGWSDYFGAVMTIKASDVGTDAVGVGTWLFGQGPNGNGIRPYPYSTDMTVNPATYDFIKQSNISVPHGLGSIWATMLWEMTWALIDEYGFDPDIYNGTGGNNIAMQLVIEGLKLQPCSPGFVDGRDAILAADQALYGGANKCLIWEAFAKRGLGFSASQGSSGSRSDGTEAFDLPASCITETTFTVDKTTAVPTDTLVYSIKVKNISSADALGVDIKSFVPDTTTFDMATNGGVHNMGEVTWPTVDILLGDSVEYEFSVIIDPAKSVFQYDFLDDVENGNNLWTVINSGSTDFVIQSGTVNSGSNAWFADDASTPGEASINLTEEIGIDTNTTLTFVHFYDTEEDWDGGRVFISLDQGGSWEDLGPYFTQNGYNSTVFNSIPAFSGNSGGFITSIIDLSNFAGQAAIVRFQKNCDQLIGGNGWYIDDIQFDNVHHMINNKAEVTNANGTDVKFLDAPNFIISNNGLELLFNVTDVSCGQTSDGAIDMTVLGCSGACTFSWSNGSTTEDLSNISGGIYYVTVSNNGINVMDSVTVLAGNQSIVTDPLDNGGTNNLRYYATTNFCPNDTIYFHPDLMGQTIVLNQRIVPLGNLNIKGLGMNNLTIDVQNINNHFSIKGGTQLNLLDLKLINGNANPNGGAFYNLGTITLNNVILEKNFEGAQPKAFTNDGTINFEGEVIIKE